MQEIAQGIAHDPVLQAAAIIIAIGSVVIFILKNIPPMAHFLFDVIIKGYRTARLNILRPAIRMARFDYIDERLILTTICRLLYRLFIRLLLTASYAYVAAFFMIILSSFEPPQEKPTLPWNDFGLDDIALIIVSTLLTSAITWFVFKPFITFLTYLNSVRRYIARDVFSEDQGKIGFWASYPREFK